MKENLDVIKLPHTIYLNKPWWIQGGAAGFPPSKKRDPILSFSHKSSTSEVGTPPTGWRPQWEIQ